MQNNNGRPGGLSSQATEPVVSALRVSIGNAERYHNTITGSKNDN